MSYHICKVGFVHLIQEVDSLMIGILTDSEMLRTMAKTPGEKIRRMSLPTEVAVSLTWLLTDANALDACFRRFR